MTIVEAFALAGFGASPMVHDQRGNSLCYASARGENEVRYYDPQGRTIGIATRVGSEIVLKDLSGRTVQRVRAR